MNWLLPANSNKYDHHTALMESGYIDWHQQANFSVGDIVYIYCAQPTKMIKYKTVVTATGLKFNETVDDKKFWKDLTLYEKAKDAKYCRLVLISDFYNENLSLPNLLENGLSSAPQRPIKISPRLNEYITKALYENELIAFDLTTNEQFSEGRQLIKQHISRERNSALIQATKQKFQHDHSGRLYCEICGFDFYEVYGEIGKDYIEAHHKRPISTMQEGEMTNINDMAIVCSNCHRIIHRKKPWLSIEQVKALINKRNN